ncbi:MAG: homoserine kinase [Candidatus Eremiobacteraeota bacterium]|nr:homoserine kinase [Candidatus Eremiobacteraeota bacterium]
MCKDSPFTVRVPATSANIGPGFDVLGIALAMYNTCTVCPGGTKLTITVEGEGGDGEIPADEQNLLYRALSRGMSLAGKEVPPLAIRQHNVIPASRGLGSSASAVVAGLLAAQRLSGGTLTPEALTGLAVEMEGHPDNVLAALRGGVVIARRSGDSSVPLSVPLGAPLEVALAIPDIKISTSAAREVLPQAYSLTDVVTSLQSVSLLIYSLITGEHAYLRDAMTDRIHEPYRAPLIRGFREAVDAALACGALGACLSGSGSTVLAFCRGSSEAVAEAMASEFRKKGISCRACVTSITAEGARIIEQEGPQAQ